jgi:1,4-dihydroxy-2-naphthoyl-CoA hydrolase
LSIRKLPIWKTVPPALTEPLAEANSLSAHLGIEIIEIGDDYVRASMPVDHRTRRSRGLLHGGASAALAETVGGFAAQLCNEPDHYCVGLQINANHIRRIDSGTVYATATPVHVGRSTQVWDIRISDAQEQIICISRLTLAVIKR